MMLEQIDLSFLEVMSDAQSRQQICIQEVSGLEHHPAK